MKTFLALALVALPFAIAFAGETTITLPDPVVTLRPGPGLELAQANCLICHSTDYLSTQPPMPRKFWEAEVKKMREKYGAPAPESAAPALVDYLAATYGAPDRKP
jgi:mono/diheme cytochrome c family protein